MSALISQVRTAARRLVRAPAFSVAALVTLALGLGATTAIFTLVDTIVLRPLPYPAADRLVRIQHPVPGTNPDWVWDLSSAGYHHFGARNRSIEAIGTYSFEELTLAGPGGAERVPSGAVSASALEIMGARPFVGRSLEPADNRPEAPPVVVLGHDFWERRFGGDRGILGRAIQLEGMARTVVGVLATDTRLPNDAVSVWTPMTLDPAAPPVNSHWMRTVARLRPGVTPGAAEQELLRLVGEFTTEFPGAYSETFMRESRFSVRVTQLRESVVGNLGSVLWILLGSVAVVLLVACANVANLFMVRAETRRREMAVRTALGANTGQLASHYLAESLLISLAAAVAGVWLADQALQLIVALAPRGLPRIDEVALTARAIGVTFGAAIVAGLVFGALPLVRLRGTLRALKGDDRNATATREQHAARGVLVVSQVALALVLLSAAGLMLRTFRNLVAIQPGVDPAGVLTFQVTLPFARYDTYRETFTFHRELAARISALPGVAATGSTQVLPFSDAAGCSLVFVEGRPVPPSAQAPCVASFSVSPGYFEAFRIPVRGRVPSWSDTERRTGEAVVSKALADRLWPGQDPLGKGVRGNGDQPPYYRVVGIAEDVRSEGKREPPIEAVYYPMLPRDSANLWSPPVSMSVVVRTSLAQPAELSASIRRVVRDLDPELAPAGFETMNRVMERKMAQETFMLILLGISAAMGLVLSAVGLYAAIAYAMGRRVNEIGIRMALGAQARQVAALVVAQSVRLVAIGVAVGLVSAIVVTRVLRASLFGVQPTDPVTLGLAALTLLCVALAAAWVPARRAVRIDPMTALRVE